MVVDKLINEEKQAESILSKSAKNVSLKEHTWIHRGGNVGTWIAIDNAEDCEIVALYLFQKRAEFMTIGHTSNIYFRNSFDIDYLIDTRNLTHYEENSDCLICECGCATKMIAKYCVERGYAGYAGLVDIPGTVGGAVVNNSGAYGYFIDKILLWVDIVTPEGTKRLSKDELKLSFRKSSLKEGTIRGVIVRAAFDISHHEQVDLLSEQAEKFHEDRKKNQDPLAYNLGTTVNVNRKYMGVRGLIVRLFLRVASMFGMKDKIGMVMPTLIGVLFFNPSVARYISKKRITCFIWKDEKADLAFDKYIRIMNTLFENCSVEIQIL